MKVYISGPMTGYEDLNRAAFHAAAKTLRGLGHEVVSPAEIEDGPDWGSCLKADLREMLACEAVVTLKGWQASRGARLEVATAIQVGMTVESFEDITLGVAP